MTSRKSRFSAGLLLSALALPLLLAGAHASYAQDRDHGGAAMVLPDHASGVYKIGDAITYTITWPDGQAPKSATYVVNYGARTQVAAGGVSMSGSTGTVTAGPFTKPGSLELEVHWTDANGADQIAIGGGIANPSDIKPPVGAPDDFASFWAGKIKRIDAVPFDAKFVPEPSGIDGVAYSKITLANLDGSRVQGQIAKPETGGKFPAIIQFQYAGVYGLPKSNVTDFAKQGFLALNVEAHDIPIDQPPSYYARQQSGPLSNYWNIGNDDASKSYYLHMYTGDYLAIKYLASRPDWDGKVLVVTGQSQGGQQSLALAGLASKWVTDVIVNVPAGCDEMAPSIGVQAGFPNWYDNINGKDPGRVRQAGRYYDPANFTLMIKCPVLAAIPMRDEHLSPPDSIFAAINQIAAPKQVIIMTRAGHEPTSANEQQPFYDAMYGQWLSSLAHDAQPTVLANPDLVR